MRPACARLVLRRSADAAARRPPALAAEVWHWLEVQSGIAAIVAATVDQFVPQMVNFELVGGVDFKKGCYPGQEVVARSQYRGTTEAAHASCSTCDAVAARRARTSSHAADAGQPAGMVVNAAANARRARRQRAGRAQARGARGGGLHLGAADGPRLRAARPALPASARRRRRPETCPSCASCSSTTRPPSSDCRRARAIGRRSSSGSRARHPAWRRACPAPRRQRPTRRRWMETYAWRGDAAMRGAADARSRAAHRRRRRTRVRRAAAGRGLRAGRRSSAADSGTAFAGRRERALASRHLDVGDAGLLELAALRREAGTLVERRAPTLRVQHAPRGRRAGAPRRAARRARRADAAVPRTLAATAMRPILATPGHVLEQPPGGRARGRSGCRPPHARRRRRPSSHSISAGMPCSSTNTSVRMRPAARRSPPSRRAAPPPSASPASKACSRCAAAAAPASRSAPSGSANTYTSSPRHAAALAAEHAGLEDDRRIADARAADADVEQVVVARRAVVFQRRLAHEQVSAERCHRLVVRHRHRPPVAGDRGVDVHQVVAVEDDLLHVHLGPAHAQTIEEAGNLDRVTSVTSVLIHVPAIVPDCVKIHGTDPTTSRKSSLTSARCRCCAEECERIGITQAADRHRRRHERRRPARPRASRHSAPCRTRCTTRHRPTRPKPPCARRPTCFATSIATA